MSFFVDIVTEDTFYENLTLGVVKILESFPYVKNVRVERRNGCESTVISSWEQRHCCTLPEDVRNFYASIDGFLLLWNIEIAGEEIAVGRMEVGTLSSLQRYASPSKKHPADSRQDSIDPERSESDPGCTGCDPDNAAPDVPSECSRDWKMFEVARCFPPSGKAKVCLVYRVKPEPESPSVWLHDEETNSWHRLADNFTIYFRMMLVHLGLPMWQRCAAGLPLPTWVEQVYYLVGPHLLPFTVEPTETISTAMWNNGPINVIDPDVFKGNDGKQKNSRKK